MNNPRMTVLVDKTGSILGCAIDAPGGDSSEVETAIVPAEGQRVVEVDAPDDLIAHLGKDSFNEHIGRLRISTDGALVSRD